MTGARQARPGLLGLLRAAYPPARDSAQPLEPLPHVQGFYLGRPFAVHPFRHGVAVGPGPVPRRPCLIFKGYFTPDLGHYAAYIPQFASVLMDCPASTCLCISSCSHYDSYWARLLPTRATLQPLRPGERRSSTPATRLALIGRSTL